MTAIGNELLAFHLGFAVYELDEATARYQALLSISEWHRWEREGPRFHLKVAYGRAAGITVEMVQVVRGEAPQSEFLRRHGEGIQHIGFWVPDMRKAVAGAVENGATVTWGVLLDGSHGLVSLSPDPTNGDLIDGLDERAATFIDPGVGGVSFEFMGPLSVERLRSTLGPAHGDVLLAPPWEAR